MRLAPDEVHVFTARPPRVNVDRVRAFLPDDERAWAESFRFERNQREHLITRALLRTTLSRYRPDVDPRAWRWKLGEHGKPSALPPCGLHFNVSNHPDMVVCAVALRDGLGIDVEPIARGEEIVGVAETVFAAEEMVGLTPDRAVTLWTVKEAWIKALGLGMSAPVREMVVDISGTTPSIKGAFVYVVDLEGHRIAVVLDGVQRATVLLRPWDFAE